MGGMRAAARAGLNVARCSPRALADLGHPVLLDHLQPAGGRISTYPADLSAERMKDAITRNAGPRIRQEIDNETFQGLTRRFLQVHHFEHLLDPTVPLPAMPIPAAPAPVAP